MISYDSSPTLRERSGSSSGCNMSVVGLLDKYTDAHKRIPNVGVDQMVLGITLHSVHFVPLYFLVYVHCFAYLHLRSLPLSVNKVGYSGINENFL